MERPGRIHLEIVPGIPEVRPGDCVSRLCLQALAEAKMVLRESDIVVVAHKILSKAEGRIVELSTVEPGAEAKRLAGELCKDARLVEVVLRESKHVLRTRKLARATEGLMICEHKLGFICANAGVDASNVEGADVVVLLPEDPDGSARALQIDFEQASGVRVGVVISDTFGRPWRRGLVNVAIGLAGLPAWVDMVGDHDAQGRPLCTTAPAFADEVAAAAGLVMAKAGQTPVVVVRGLDWPRSEGSAKDFIRPEGEDLFR